MTRSTPVEWDLFGTGPWDYSVNSAAIYQFWLAGAERAQPYENVYTMGMRGAGDRTYRCSHRCRRVLMTSVQCRSLRARTFRFWRRSSRTSAGFCRRSSTPPTSPLSLRCGVSVSRLCEHAEVRHMTEPCYVDKEVLGYYEDGMTVPDDITLLWTDDK